MQEDFAESSPILHREPFAEFDGCESSLQGCSGFDPGSVAFGHNQIDALNRFRSQYLSE